MPLYGSSATLTDHTHAATGSGATGGGATINAPTLNGTGLVIAGGIITSTIDADQNDYAPTGIHTKSIIYFTSLTANRTLTGITAGTEGERLVLQNNTALSLLLAHESASSSANNRFRNPNGGTITIRQRGTMELEYIQGRWCSFGA